MSELPDWFGPVAEDVLRYCRPQDGLWVDLGSGAGGLGLALARASTSAIVLLDPNAEALRKGGQAAQAAGLSERVRIIAGRAEEMPFREGSADLIVSRGSIFFWERPADGLREVHRILRPGARAMIGGGFGTSYPDWALKEFFRRRNSDVEAQGEKAVRAWDEPRRPEWLAAHAHAAGLDDLLIEPTPPRLWLLFEKRA